MAKRGALVGRVFLKIVLLFVFVVMVHGVRAAQLDASRTPEAAPQWERPDNVTRPFARPRPQRV